MADDPGALVPVVEVLDIIQRSLMLIGNTNNLVSEIRREIALDAIATHPLKNMRKEILRMPVPICLEKNLKTT